MKNKSESHSTKTRSAFSKRFCMQLKDNRKIFIISFIMQMLGFPFFLLLRDLANRQILSSEGNILSSEKLFQDESLELYTHLSNLSQIIAAAAFFSGVFTAIWFFRYLHGKSGSDLVMSLPVNRKQLFSADFLAGLITYIFPYLIALISVLPLMISWHNTELRSDPETEYMNNIYYLYTYYVPSPEIIVKSGILFLIAMLFIYSFSVLVTVCCGTIYDSIACLVISNISLYLLCFNTDSIISAETTSQYFNYDYLFLRICPPGALLYAVRYLYLYDEAPYSCGMINWIIWILALSVLCSAAACILFKRRKTEVTGNLLAFYPMFCAVHVCLTAAAVSFFACRKNNFLHSHSDSELPGFLILSLLSSFFIYFILLSLKERKVRFKQSPKKFVMPAVVFVTAAGFFTAFTRTGAFGAEYRVPYAGAVAEATIEFKPFSDTYTDKETIKLITDLHKELNNDLRNSSEDTAESDYYTRPHESKTFCSDYNIFSADHNDELHYDSSDTITIEYVMKNGKQYRKNFTPCETDYMESEIYKVVEEDYKNRMNDPDREFPEIISKLLFGKEHVKYSDVSSEIINYISDRKYRVFCGRTDFEKELFGCSSVPYVSSTRRYPYEYVLTDSDKNLLNEIISRSYYQYYYDTRECFVFTIVIDDESTEHETEYYYTKSGEKVWIRKPVKFILMLPPEYADLYSKLIESSKAETVEWTEKKE
ncbi:MAG: ABC transporter permease [Oscillospiraceae bacterium]|nr:ABC transporter permease [Oscillospiraceae bacterium]